MVDFWNYSKKILVPPGALHQFSTTSTNQKDFKSTFIEKANAWLTDPCKQDVISTFDTYLVNYSDQVRDFLDFGMSINQSNLREVSRANYKYVNVEKGLLKLKENSKAHRKNDAKVNELLDFK